VLVRHRAALFMEDTTKLYRVRQKRTSSTKLLRQDVTFSFNQRAFFGVNRRRNCNNSHCQ